MATVRWFRREKEQAAEISDGVSEARARLLRAVATGEQETVREHSGLGLATEAGTRWTGLTGTDGVDGDGAARDAG
jgi:hypothetical protein